MSNEYVQSYDDIFQLKIFKIQHFCSENNEAKMKKKNFHCLQIIHEKM